MAVRLTDLVREQRTVTVDVRGQVFDVVYRPGAMTPQLGASLDEDEDAPIAAILSGILLRWDIFDDSAADESGNPGRVPVDYETLRTMPSELLAKVQRAILEDIFGSKNSSATSGDTSRPGVNSAKRQNGMR